MSVISTNDPLSLGAAKPVTPKSTGNAAAPGAVRTPDRAASGIATSRKEAPATEAPRTTDARPEEIQSALAALSQAVEAKAPSELQFEVDKDTGRTIVRIVDASTGETIRQIPPEELIEIAKSIDQMQGLLLRQEA